MAFSFGAAAASAPAPPQDTFSVDAAPGDSTSALRWSPAADLLAASSWDGKVRIYQASPMAANGIAMFDAGAPVLDVCWSQDGSKVYSVGTDKRGLIYDAASQQTMQFAQHDAPIKAVRTVQLPGSNEEYVATASWDATLRYWDPRSPREMLKVQLPERAYAMDYSAPYLVVACADRHMVAIDMREGPDKMKHSFSPLKWQTRTVGCFSPTSTEAPRLGRVAGSDAFHGYIIGSIEGRVYTVYHDAAANKEHGFSFRCHRKDFKTGIERETEKRKAVADGTINTYGAYSVNSIAFSHYGTYATAGSDGQIFTWDNAAKARLKTFDKQAGPVTATAFSRDASLFAYSVSYDWSQGHMGAGSVPNSIMIYRTKAEEVRRKPRR